jgi:hypothetical protein
MKTSRAFSQLGTLHVAERRERLNLLSGGANPLRQPCRALS